MTKRKLNTVTILFYLLIGGLVGGAIGATAGSSTTYTGRVTTTAVTRTQTVVHTVQPSACGANGIRQVTTQQDADGNGVLSVICQNGNVLMRTTP